MQDWRRGRFVLVAAVAGVLVAGCSSDEAVKSGITIDTLAASSGTACPLPLEVSADDSGIDTPTPATGSVVVGRTVDTGAGTGTGTETGAGTGSTPLSAIDAAEGVAVTCSLALADGSAVTLYLVAARTEAAPELVVPVAAQAGGLDANQTTQLLNDVTRTEVGELVPVPGADAVAMLRTSIGGATSAALALSAPTLKRAQVEQVARQLDQRLR